MPKSYNFDEVIKEESKDNGKYMYGDDSTSKSDDTVEYQNVGPQNAVGVFELFRFADKWDRLMILIAMLTSALHGCCQPMMIVVFGSMADTFIDNAIFNTWVDSNWRNISMFFPNGTSPDDLKEDPAMIIPILDSHNQTEIIEEIESRLVTDLLDQIQLYALIYTGIGFGVFFFAYTHIACWEAAAARMCQRIRGLLFGSIVKQDIGWFDTHEVGELNSRLSDDVDQIQLGVGDKLGMFVQFSSTFLSGFIIAFVYGWRLAIVILAVTPLMALPGGIMAKLGTTFTKKELQAYATAGSIAEEVISSIRTVVAFGGERKECIRYSSNLKGAREFGIKKGMAAGFGMGGMFAIMFCAFALAFWYGSSLVWDGRMTGGDVLVVFFCMLMGAFSIGNATPNIQEFSTSRGAAYAVFKVIDEVPVIDGTSERGYKPDKIHGNIEFRNITFKYPARPEVTVLSGLNLKVAAGKTAALVGNSGCGKSTTVQLLQRFYDPLEGQILIDNKDIRELNVEWLRQHIGVVSQEPVLFATTIEENIRYGREDVTMEEIISAAKQANAHNFIRDLPQKYNTLVGERGAQLSGGQKQRIAIARALVRDPKILLLDEATSALDTESESIVQDALDKARAGRTTLVIAHRLSTIQTADMIAGVEDGRIVEQGTHEELLKLKGVYYTLVMNQTNHFSNEEFVSPALEKPALISRTFSIQSNSSRGSLRKRTISTGTEKDFIIEEEEEVPTPDMKRVLRMNAPETPYIIIGCFAAIIAGAIQPTFSVILAEILGVYSELDQEEQQRLTDLYSGLFAVVGLIAGTSMFLLNYMFAISGEKLTFRLRELTFQTIVHQDIEFFDDHNNTTGALTTRLATDASAVKGATGVRLGVVFRSLSAVAAGVGIGFYFSWKLTLVVLAFAPIIIMAGFVQTKLVMGQAGGGRIRPIEAGKIASETIVNIRTVAALTKEKYFHQQYLDMIIAPTGANMKRATVFGLGYGVAQGTIFWAYAASFSYGATLVESEEITYVDLFRVVSAIAMGAMSIGNANSFAPDYGKAKQAAGRLFTLFDRKPTIDSFSEAGETPGNCNGSVALKGVCFHYPTRPDVKVLRGLELKVDQGQQIALVGSSGCGKSTTVQLLERFYNPTDGFLTLDGSDISNLQIRWLRQQIGIVSQEPILFDCSIKDNIAYGDNTRHVTMMEVVEAAKKANIHNFISTLPLGYDTNVGDKGTQLSGGQKQRVAIARALIRNPKILLLDEATSALDTESEKVVQEALDKAQEGRTSIVIAHRLSTIQNADCICVLNNGRVAETGTHNELLAQKGIYYNLHTKQLRKK